MKWLIVTCDKSRHILRAQNWLFVKYAPEADVQYIDLGVNDLERWGPDVAKQLPDDPFVVFGLDDYLPIGELNNYRLSLGAAILKEKNYDRWELFGPHVHNRPGIRTIDYWNWSYYEMEPGTTPYTVSCQFSVWRTTTLKRILNDSTTPWNFEVSHACEAACFTDPTFKYIEESALSKRWTGKINVNGMKADDVNELVRLGYLDESKLIHRAFPIGGKYRVLKEK